MLPLQFTTLMFSLGQRFVTSSLEKTYEKTGGNNLGVFICSASFYVCCKVKLNVTITIMIKIYRIKKIPLKSIFHSMFIVNYRIVECHDMSSIAQYLIKVKIYISTFKIPPWHFRQFYLTLFLPNKEPGSMR